MRFGEFSSSHKGVDGFGLCAASGIARSTGCALVSVVLLVSCGGSAPEPPVVTPPSGNETITGTERLGWDQRAGDPSELATIRYAVYVDGGRTELTGVTCAGSATAAGYACSAPLPPLTPGAHTLELASFIQDTSLLESARSAALRVTVTGATASSSVPANATPARKPAEGQATAGAAHSATDGHDPWPLNAMRIVEGLDRPSDLVVLPDGRVMIAERAGRVRVVQDDGLVDRPALSVESDDPRIGAVLAVAIDPQFPRTHFVYAIYTSRSRQGSTVFTVARFREVSNTLADRVVLLDGIRASADPHAALRVGPDAKLYAAFDDGGEERLAADPASFNGKILRLNLDGTTPADQPRGSPILSVGPRSPRGLDWHRQSGHLWSAGERHVGSLRSTTPLAAIAASEDALFVASAAGLMRARVDPHNLERFAGIDEVLHGVVIRAMATKADGTIVFATDTAVGTVAPPNGR